MKTTLYLLAVVAATAAMTSCSQDEPISVSNANTISFRPALGASRATETTNANLSQITVSSFIGDQLYIDQVPYTKGGDGFFTSTPEYNWPGDDSELTFYAYSPATLTGTLTLTKDTKTLADFSPATSPADQIDFITATATGTRSANEASGVELTFNHRLSQIEVLAKTDNDVYTFEISGIRIGQPVSTGTFDFTTEAWTNGTDKTIYEETYSTPRTLTSTAASVMGDGGNAMLLPQQLTAWNPASDSTNTAKGAYLSVKLRITATATGAQLYPFPSDTECDWAAIPVDTNWEAGKKYIYTLDLTHGAGYVDPDDPQPGKPVLGGPIKFTVDVLDWTDTPVDLSMEPGASTAE